jgi:hypothetical protein
VAMKKEKAIEILEGLIDQIEALKKDVALSAAHTRWVANVFSATDQIFGTASTIYGSLIRLTWRREGSFIVDPWVQGTMDYNEAMEIIHHEAYLKQLDTAKGLLKAGIDEINNYGIENVHKSPDTSKKAGEIIQIINLADTKLRKIIRSIPQIEKEVQDKFEDLLVATEIKHLREQERIVYSSKTYQPDFSFPEINAVLEIKLCNKAGRDKEIISEINDDILAYRTKYPNIIFLVYDVGIIRDVSRFKEDIETQEGVFVLIIKH